MKDVGEHCFSMPVGKLDRKIRQKIIKQAVRNYGPVKVTYYTHPKYGRMMVVREEVSK